VVQIPERYQPQALSDEAREGWFAWSLDFFTEPEVLQVPYVDLTLQLEVGAAYARYLRQEAPGGSFFAYLIWHFVQGFKSHPSFLLRQVDGVWWLLRNPPVIVPIAVAGPHRFRELVLEDVALLDYPAFCVHYREQLARARAGVAERPAPELFYLGHFFGNLPNLPFSGLTLHYRRESIAGQSLFYFGKRYRLEGRLHIPLAAKLHHACTDPHVLDLLLADVQRAMRGGGVHGG